MPNFKVVWEFGRPDGSTFGEQYYCPATDANNATTVVSQLDSKRLALLHPNNRLLRIRASQVGGGVPTASRTINLAGTAPVDNPDRGTGPGWSIVIGLTGQTGGSRKLWMRGCSSADLGTPDAFGVPGVAPGFQTRLTTWARALQDNSYGILTKKKVDGVLVIKYQVVKVDGGVQPGYAYITTDVNHNLLTGNQVQFGLMDRKTLPGLNGTYTVLGVTATTIKVRYQVANNAVVLNNLGYAKKVLYNDVSVFDRSSVRFDYLGEHSTKSPLSRSRGARRAVRVRNSV